MKEDIYSTRQRATDLINEALAIWQKGDHIDQLEGLATDPVFSLLMTALAYRANEMDSEIERLRQDVLDEFARLLMPYEASHAVPATTVVEAELQNDVPELTLSETSIFTLTDSGFTFMPLLRSRLINATINSVIRLDGRRWKVVINFSTPVSDLSGLTFAVRDARFKDLKITVNGHQMLPLIKPWNYANLPLQPCFSVAALLYNRAEMYQASLTPLEIYARQNVALFSVAHTGTAHLLSVESDRVELTFDFTGIPTNFVFDKDHIKLNTILLVNAKLSTATLTADKPIVRLAGEQLMHLLPPASEQLFGKTPVTVRRIGADRFNRAALRRLVNSLSTKFDSDYYAFLQVDNANIKTILTRIQEGLVQLIKSTQNNAQVEQPGVYLMLERKAIANQAVSLDISYLTTSGAALNGNIKPDSQFTSPAGIKSTSVRQIASPVYGIDETDNTESAQTMLRYYMVTNDRIVTPADIKLFCYDRLMSLYTIGPDLVDDISVRNRLTEQSDSGYCIQVSIVLHDNSFIRRTFEDKIPQAEMLLQTMMEIRSNQLYPIYVSIHIMKEQN
ncbi:MAG: hypothetical protein IJU36_02675 [Paludibacteraceae bacterium]|nr:hypothetical protein [Paludibacteraceae bacterium]